MAPLERSSGLRVLYIVNAFPWPLTSGYLRHYHLIRELASRGHRITLLSIVASELEPTDRAALESSTERIVAVPSDRSNRSLRGKTIRRLQVISGGEPAATRLRDELTALRLDGDYDVALISGIRTFPALRALDGLPVVADVCDAASARVMGNLRHGPVGRLPLLVAELIEARIVERALVQHSVHTLFASRRDLQAVVGSEPGSTSTVVPNGVDLEYWRRPPHVGLGRREIVLSGAMDYPPNTDAALHLIHHVLPRVREEIPDAHLTIVGRDPTPALVGAGQSPGVTVTGRVADVRPFLLAASVFAAPLRFGAGIQNKLLEALAMQLPTVASTNAADGLVAADGSTPPLTVADEPDLFAAVLVRQLRAAEANPTPPIDGRDFVGRHFAWSRSGEILDQILRTAATKADAQ